MLAAGLLPAASLLARDCFPAPSELAGWWPGDGNAHDIAGTNNGVFQGTANATAAGLVGPAFSFDGTNGFVSIPDSPVFHPTNLTVECWVRFNSLDSAGTSPAGDEYMVFKQNSLTYTFEGFDLRKLRINGNDIFKFAVTSSNAQTAELHGTTLVATGVWYHVAGVRGSNYIQLYVNGNLEGQTNANYPQDYGNLPLYFGTSGASYYDHKLNGVLDEVSLYHRALSASDIAALYAAGGAGKCKAASIVTPPQSQAVLAGSNAAFTVTAAGFGTLSYQWQFNGAAIPGTTAAALVLTNAQPTNAGSYTVIVTNALGAATSAAAALTIAGRPVLLNPRTVAGGGFAFTIGGATGLVYLVEVSTNLVKWAPASSVSNLAGPAEFTDSAASTNVRRFYRASWAP